MQRNINQTEPRENVDFTAHQGGQFAEGIKSKTKNWKKIVSFQSISHYFTEEPSRLCVFVVSVWVACGIIFYQFYDNWTTATAFYYSVEGGLSVGFCYPDEIDDQSRLYTIFYVMVASSAVSGSLGLFLQYLFKENSHLVPAEYTLNTMQIRDDQGHITFRSTVHYTWYLFKYLFGWYHNRFLTVMTVLLLLWVAVGTIYGAYQEGYTFITSLYFAVTACSAGGLQSPPCLGSGDDGTACNVGDFRGSFLGIYIMIGVPIYAVTLSQYAQLVFAPFVAERELKLIESPIEDVQFLFAANVLWSNAQEPSETLLVGEYILLDLLRLGLVDQERIESLKKKFSVLDTQNKGELVLSDLHAVGRAVPQKLHSAESENLARGISLRFGSHIISSVHDSDISTPGSSIRPLDSSMSSSKDLDKCGLHADSLFNRVDEKEGSDAIELVQIPPVLKRSFRKSWKKSVHRCSTVSPATMESSVEEPRSLLPLPVLGEEKEQVADNHWRNHKSTCTFM